MFFLSSSKTNTFTAAVEREYETLARERASLAQREAALMVFDVYRGLLLLLLLCCEYLFVCL
jgi:ABC-type cobalamin transport system ATPase subunit